MPRLHLSSKTAAGAFPSPCLLCRIVFFSLADQSPPPLPRSIQRTAEVLSLDPLKVAAYVKVHTGTGIRFSLFSFSRA